MQKSILQSAVTLKTTNRLTIKTKCTPARLPASTSGVKLQFETATEINATK
jgi:hypothetical protein